MRFAVRGDLFLDYHTPHPSLLGDLHAAVDPTVTGASTIRQQPPCSADCTLFRC